LIKATVEKSYRRGLLLREGLVVVQSPEDLDQEVQGQVLVEEGLLDTSETF
jgi:hypothetical protein